MPHLWERLDHHWAPMLLENGHPLPHGCQLRSGGAKGSLFAPECWFLLCPSGAAARVNGETLMLGTKMLKDRDELHIEDRRFFFSTEKLAGVVRFRGAEGSTAVICARCKQPLKDDQAAVECPACGAWHHQADEMGCWLYGEKCSLCDQPTTLDVGYRWTPEEVWT